MVIVIVSLCGTGVDSAPRTAKGARSAASPPDGFRRRERRAPPVAAATTHVGDRGSDRMRPGDGSHGLAGDQTTSSAPSGELGGCQAAFNAEGRIRDDGATDTELLHTSRFARHNVTHSSHQSVRSDAPAIGRPGARDLAHDGYADDAHTDRGQVHGRSWASRDGTHRCVRLQDDVWWRGEADDTGNNPVIAPSTPAYIVTTHWSTGSVDTTLVDAISGEGTTGCTGCDIVQPDGTVIKTPAIH